MKQTAITIVLALFCPIFAAAATGEAPGWAGCSSIYTAGDYDLTGGGDNGSMIVLTAAEGDMRQAVLDAVRNYDVIVFDGRDGDFEISSSIPLISLTKRTLVGVNNARLFTTFTVPDSFKQLLDSLNVKALSGVAGPNTGGTLSNGSKVAEDGEFAIRQALIDLTGDQTEPYRMAGIFNFINCSNMIIRNLDFVGPGSLDVGGADLLTLDACNHVWVDHCRFTDGIDGNFDIVNNSDFITVSDNHFRYTDRSYNHPLSNLTSGQEITDGSPQKCNISWIRCFWDEGCLGRMPFTSFGIHHILNCYWNCTKGRCIDAHNLSKVLIEDSYFASKVGNPLVVSDMNVKYEWRGSVWYNHTPPRSNAVVTVPYAYTSAQLSTVPTLAKQTGPTLREPFSRELTASPAAIDFGTVYSNNTICSRFNLSAFGENVPQTVTLTATGGTLLSTDAEGGYTMSVTIPASRDDLLQADIFVKAVFENGGSGQSKIIVSTPDGNNFEIPVTARVIPLTGEAAATTISWALDKGASSPRAATTQFPEAFTDASFSLGDYMAIHSGKTIGSRSFTLFNTSETIDKIVNRDCFISFDVVCAPGYIFVPKALSFDASRIGTDQCLVDIECCRDSAGPLNLITAYQPPRANSTERVSVPLDNIGVGNGLHLKLFLYYMATNKQLALGNVTIEGDLYSNQASIAPVVIDNAAASAVYFDLQGRRVTHPRQGHLYLMKTGSSTRVIQYQGQ